MVENPIFLNSKLEVNLEELITRHVPQQILSTKQMGKTEPEVSISQKNLREVFSSLQIGHSKVLSFEKTRHERRISTGVPHARNLRVQTLPAEEKSAIFSHISQKYKSPSQGGRSNLMGATTASSKATRNVQPF